MDRRNFVHGDHSEKCSVDGSPVLLDTLLDDEDIPNSTIAIHIQNLEADPLGIALAPSTDAGDAPANYAAMGMLPYPTIHPFEMPRESLRRLYVCGAGASHTFYVWLYRRA